MDDEIGVFFIRPIVEPLVAEAIEEVRASLFGSIILGGLGLLINVANYISSSTDSDSDTSNTYGSAA